MSRFGAIQTSTAGSFLQQEHCKTQSRLDCSISAIQSILTTIHQMKKIIIQLYFIETILHVLILSSQEFHDFGPQWLSFLGSHPVPALEQYFCRNFSWNP